MGKIFISIATILGAILITNSCCKPDVYAQLSAELNEFVNSQNAEIGIAVIIESKDTIEVNGTKPFPMMSVLKFPVALAVADFCQRHNISFTDSIDICPSEILPDTYSPMREKYGRKSLRLPISELLSYSINHSDNNACDILLRMIGGTQTADSLTHALGFRNIAIKHTEEEMHTNTELTLANSATPLEMAKLLDKFNTRLKTSSEHTEYIAVEMESCLTGTDRLAAALPEDWIIGHKTGTGDLDATGHPTALNDAAYINLPDGRHYAVAVFVANSNETMAATTEMIAAISQIIVKHLGN